MIGNLATSKRRVRCFLTSTAHRLRGKCPQEDEAVSILRGLKPDRSILVHSPEEAEIILFAESHKDEACCGKYLDHVLRDPVFVSYPFKCLVHCGSDQPYPIVPGFYPSICSSWPFKNWARSSCYLTELNPAIEPLRGEWRSTPNLLASFHGCVSRRPVRKKLVSFLKDPRIHVEDTEQAFIASIRAQEEQDILALKQRYVLGMLESHFVLCPRGFGASSIRLFEAMACGRAPVIISDEWVPPRGPDWSTFSVRVRERDVEKIPRILRELEPNAPAFGENARLAWEEWFSPVVLLDRLVVEGLEILQTNRSPEWTTRLIRTYLNLDPKRILSRAESVMKSAMARFRAGYTKGTNAL